MRTLKNNGLIYIPSSYEEVLSMTFLRDVGTNVRGDIKLVSASNLLLGENLVSYMDMTSSLSHYQVMRFVTEIFPASVAIEGTRNVGTIWSVFFYFAAIVFSFGHLIVIWGTVIDSIISIMPRLFKLWRPLVTFIICVLAFMISLSMASNVTINVIQLSN